MSPAHPASIDLRAVSAVLAELGADRASGADLARAAGVAKPTLYARFGTREAVVEACIEQEAEHLVERIVGSGAAHEAIAGYTRESAGWTLLLLSRHPAAIAARGRIAARIAEEHSGATRVGAAAFLAAAAAVIESGAPGEPTPASLAHALLRSA